MLACRWEKGLFDLDIMISDSKAFGRRKPACRAEDAQRKAVYDFARHDTESITMLYTVKRKGGLHHE